MTQYVFHADINKFNPNTTHYFGENALLLADCAKLAYKPENEIREAMQTQLKFKNFQFFSGESTQGFIAGNDAIIIIAFRGTEGKKVADVIADARVAPTQGPVGLVHTGFNHALHEVWDAMRPTITRFQDNKQTIWFCGHSLGAALATLAAAEYVINDGGTVNGLYTIGQPRVGDDKFATHFDNVLINKCFRFVNNNDVVTRIPIPDLVCKYTHVGNMLYIDSAGRLNDSIPWWKKLWDGIKGLEKDIGSKGLDGLKDHSSDGYVQLITDNRSVTTKWS